MADAPEIHPPHRPHGVGATWLELVLTLAALFTSTVSVVIALEHGEAMRQLVTASSLPYLQVVSGNAGGDLKGGDKPSYLNLRNVGVGPAQVRQLQVQGPDGRYFTTLQSVVQACCNHAEAEQLQQSYTINNVPQRFIPARDVESVFTIRRTRENQAAWTKFDAFRDRLHVSGCYCSVFNECYRFDSLTGGADRQKTCLPNPAREFRPLF